MMKYRADVDGLRRRCHRRYCADISSLPGGFIGVDVFFLISGYSDPLSAKVITRTGIENAGASTVAVDTAKAILDALTKSISQQESTKTAVNAELERIRKILTTLRSDPRFEWRDDGLRRR